MTTISDYGFCQKCQSYVGKASHTCPPAWECAIDHGDGEPYWQTYHAHSEDMAAEKYADAYDSGGDYTIVGAGDGGNTIILVRPEGNESAKPKRFHVIGETVAQYSAREVKEL